jgi:hypothetical protein
MPVRPAPPLATILVLLASFSGCHDGAKEKPVRDEMFAPASIRIHPTFTQFKDWTGDGQPDGIEALVEVQDSFGEPTRAKGSVMFELDGYRPQNPEQRGYRIAGPWRMDVRTVAEQQEAWNRATRAYTFRLPMPVPAEHAQYVLSAQFDVDPSGGGAAHRLFDELVLEKKRVK